MKHMSNRAMNPPGRCAIATSFVLAFALTVAAGANAQDSESSSPGIYTWTDEDGTVHFTEEAPKNVDAKTVTVEPPPPVSSPYESVTESAGDAGADDENLSPGARARQQRLEREQANSEAQAQRQQLEEACDRARQQVINLESRTNVLVQDPDGGTTRLGDDRRLEMLEETRGFITDNCD